jgi:hypothetical protein
MGITYERRGTSATLGSKRDGRVDCSRVPYRSERGNCPDGVAELCMGPGVPLSPPTMNREASKTCQTGIGKGRIAEQGLEPALQAISV